MIDIANIAMGKMEGMRMTDESGLADRGTAKKVFIRIKSGSTTKKEKQGNSTTLLLEDDVTD